ncbi:HPr family phosphocarrier protein [Tessaracoccus sp. Z1128]
MASITVTVGSSVGLHARPAAIVAEAAGAYDDDITLRIAGTPEDEGVDAASSLMIMTLGASAGAQVTVESDNAEAVAALGALIEQDLDA